MSDVDRLFKAFVAAERAGEDPDPRSYLAQAGGADRAELGALIQGVLERTPRGAFSAERYRGSSAERVMESLTAEAGTWPTLLPQLRAEARLPRDALVARLTAALGVAGREQKVHRYYHEMEQGLLPSKGVSDRVLGALGSLFGVSAAALRRAGEGVGGTLGMATGAADAPPAFARAAPAAAEAEGAPAAPAPAGAAEQEQWDEVDELFRGG